MVAINPRACGEVRLPWKACLRTGPASALFRVVSSPHLLFKYNSTYGSIILQSDAQGRWRNRNPPCSTPPPHARHLDTGSWVKRRSRSRPPCPPAAAPVPAFRAHAHLTVLVPSLRVTCTKTAFLLGVTFFHQSAPESYLFRNLNSSSRSRDVIFRESPISHTIETD